MESLDRELGDLAEMPVPPAPTLGELRRRGLQLRRHRRVRRLATGLAAVGLVALGAAQVDSSSDRPVVVADDHDAPADPATEGNDFDLTDAQGVLERLHRYHTPPGPPEPDQVHELRPAATVSFGFGDRIVVTATRDELRGADAWHVPIPSDTGRSGVYAFDAFFEKTEPDDYAIEIGDYHRCGRGARPSVLADADRVSVQPAGAVPCDEWWSVDVFVNEAGEVVALTAQWAEPPAGAVQVVVLNASGRCGIAGDVTEVLSAPPFADRLAPLAPANAEPVDRSTVYSTPQALADARDVAAVLRPPAQIEDLDAPAALEQLRSWDGALPPLVVVLGADQARSWPGC